MSFVIWCFAVVVFMGVLFTFKRQGVAQLPKSQERNTGRSGSEEKRVLSDGKASTVIRETQNTFIKGYSYRE